MNGSLATIVETPLEDETFARWQRREFTGEERIWARQFRQRMGRPLNTKLYVDNIAKAGLSFNPPQSDEELISSVNDLLASKKLLPRLFAILAWDFSIKPIDEITKRWYKEGRRSFEEFAPYAFFCMKANFLWHLSLANPELFKRDKKQNDRKDLEYCYYLPNTQIFATRDDKQHRLMAALIRPDQSLVKAEDLKADLRKISEDWNRLTTQEKIALNAQRRGAPPENTDSLIYQLWKKHDGKINPSKLPDVSNRKFIDASLPKEQQVQFTLAEFTRRKINEIREGKRLSEKEMEDLNQRDITMLMFNSRINRERLRKWSPQLTEPDVDKLTLELTEQVWLDPYEYRDILFC